MDRNNKTTLSIMMPHPIFKLFTQDSSLQSSEITMQNTPLGIDYFANLGKLSTYVLGAHKAPLLAVK